MWKCIQEKFSQEGFAREWGSFILVALFEALFVGAALLQSKGMAFHRIYTNDGYYHTEQVSVVNSLLVCMAIFLLIQYLLIRYSYERRLCFSKLLCPIFVISTVGIVFHMYAGSGGTKYFILLLMGIAVMVCFVFLGTFTLNATSCKVLSCFMICLAMINMVYGCLHRINGSGAWVNVFGISIQPGEIFKIFIVMYLSYAYIYIRDNKTVRRMFVATIVLQIITLLVVKDFGNALIILFLCMFVILPFYSIKVALTGIVDVVVGLYFLCAIVQALGDALGNSYLVRRFSVVFHIFEKTEETQYRNVLYGVLRGGMQGTGLAEGAYTYSTTAYAATTDYAFLTIMAVFGIGIALVVLGSIALIVLNANLSMEKHWELSRFCTGKIVSSVLVIQVLFHVAGGLNIFPFTGVTFPFLSAGGSAMFTNFAIIGMILSSQLPYGEVQNMQGKIYGIKTLWEERKYGKSVC